MSDDRTVVITDVSPRDGLQNQTRTLSVQDRLGLIQRLAAARVPSIEIGSFVSPRAVPQMAGTGDLVHACPHSPALRLSALTPNMKGLERALECGIQEIAVVLSATETMNQRNIRMSLDAATQVCIDVLRTARHEGLRTRAYIAVAIACPFEGSTPVSRVTTLADAMLNAEADEIILADTIGAGTPGQVDTLLRSIAHTIPIERIGAHFHDTRGMGIANAWVALQNGVRRLDGSVGGLGGCPFAPGAAGNVATEDLILLAEQSGFRTGIDPVGLIAAIDHAQAVLGMPLGGRSLPWQRRQYGEHKPNHAIRQ